MPRKAEIPEHWKEGADQPEWSKPDDDVVFDNSKYGTDPDMVYDENEPEHIDLIDAEPEDLLNDPGTTRDDVKLSTKEKELDKELAMQTEKWEKMQTQKQTKQRIKEKKSQIRKMKYAPAYEAGAKLKLGAGKLKSAIDKKRGSPMERKARRDKSRAQLKKLAGVAKKKAVSFGKSMKEDRSGKKPGMIGGGFGSKFFDQNNKMDFGGSKTPNVMKMNLASGSTGSKLMGGGKNLLGNTGQKLMGSNSNMFKQSSGKPGSKFMNANILGSVKGNKGKRLF